VLSGDDAELVAAGVGDAVESAITGLELDMAAQAVGRGGDRDERDEVVGAVVEEVGRDDEARTVERRFVADWLAEVDVVDLAAPDQASESHSARSSRYACQRSGSARSWHFDAPAILEPSHGLSRGGRG